MRLRNVVVGTALVGAALKVGRWSSTQEGRGVDAELFGELNRGHGQGADRFFAGVTELGSIWAAGAAAGILALTGRRRAAANAFAAAGVAWLAGQGLKKVANRPRPYEADADGTRLLVGPPKATSWPSSHPAVLTAFTRVAARDLALGPISRTGLAGLDLSVAASRVYVGVHYPSDVVSGLLIGRAIGALLARAPFVRPAATLAPMLSSFSTFASVGWPVLDRFRFGDAFAISPHGLGIAIGFMIGGWLLGRIGVRRGVTPEHISTMLFWALIGAILGSRIAYVIAHLSEFDSPLEWLYVWKGGISLLGGITGAIVINIPRMRKYGYRFFQVMDPAAVALALGIGIGRIGDLIIGDHLGKPTSWWLAWTYHGGNLAPPFNCVNEVCQAQLQGGHLQEIRRTGATLLDVKGHILATGVGVHQTALYDMILAWILFAILWNLYKKPRREGVITLTFGLFYGCARLLEDSLRIDKRFGPFTGSQWTALTVATISAGMLIWWAIEARRSPPPDHDEGVGDDIGPDGEPERAIGAT